VKKKKRKAVTIYAHKIERKRRRPNENLKVESLLEESGGILAAVAVKL
jgi:hypothetical protein